MVNQKPSYRLCIFIVRFKVKIYTYNNGYVNQYLFKLTTTVMDTKFNTINDHEFNQAIAQVSMTNVCLAAQNYLLDNA